MGNFDGVHLGHQSVLALAHAAAAELGAPFGVVTFEPHPRSFFAPDAPPFRLMTADARARRLEKLGVEVLYELPFDAGARRRSSPEALRAPRCWRRASGCGTWWSAPTSASARARAGDAGTLKALGRRLGFGVDRGAAGVGRGRATSPRPRSARRSPRAGPEEAARILGHWHRIEGAVQHGDKRGKAPGLPDRQPLRSTGCTCRASASTR